MKRRLRRIGEALTSNQPSYRVENPERFPAWVWLRPPDAYDAPRKRGGPVFEEMARLGFRVTMFDQGIGVRVQPGWAADLAAINPNVYLLPNFEEHRGDEFGLRLAEIALASAQVKQARQAARREMGL